MPVSTHARLILASGSICRKMLLEQAGLAFEVIPADLDESVIKNKLAHEAPEVIALELAKAKAAAVSRLHPDAMVIGGDQICALTDTSGTRIFDKPGDEQTARRHLTALSGTTHTQLSAVCMYQAGECVWSLVDSAELQMRPLSAEEIAAYVKLDQPLACAGAYKFESLGCHLFVHVTGSAHTIQGLPLLPLLAALRDQGIMSLC